MADGTDARRRRNVSGTLSSGILAICHSGLILDPLRDLRVLRGEIVPVFAMHLAEPYWLLLLVLVPLPWLWERARARLRWPTLAGFARAPRAGAGWVRHLPSALRGLAIAALAGGRAGRQTVGGRTRIAAGGVAIVVALDRSQSMTTRDFPAETEPVARLDAARATLARFVAGRPDDL